MIKFERNRQSSPPAQLHRRIVGKVANVSHLPQGVFNECMDDFVSKLLVEVKSFNKFILFA